jgi:hypothetical protein
VREGWPSNETREVCCTASSTPGRGARRPGVAIRVGVTGTRTSVGPMGAYRYSLPRLVTVGCTANTGAGVAAVPATQPNRGYVG